jgi:hypothetical protein
MSNLKVNVDNVNTWLPGSHVRQMGVPMRGESACSRDYQRVGRKLSSQVVSAVCSDRAWGGLVKIANRWAQEHRPDIRDTEEIYMAVNNFRDLLIAAKVNFDRWPTIVFAWKLPAEWFGFFYRHDTSAAGESRFQLGSQYIVLNGLVGSLYSGFRPLEPSRTAR